MISATQPLNDLAPNPPSTPTDSSSTNAHLPALTIAIAAFAGLIAAGNALPLFQDGAYYFLKLYYFQELFAPHSRHATVLFQVPAWLGATHGLDLADTRLLFGLGYALIPALALLLSWLVVRRDGPELFIWPALYVLLINTVNFSWVSELLIALQLFLPLYLSMLLYPGRGRFWLIFLLTTPLLFTLHPLIAGVFFAAGQISLVLALLRNIEYRRYIQMSLALTLLGLGKLGWSLLFLSGYEQSHASRGGLAGYFFHITPESLFLLFASTAIGLVLLTHHNALQRRLMGLGFAVACAACWTFSTVNMDGQVAIPGGIAGLGALVVALLLSLLAVSVMKRPRPQLEPSPILPGPILGGEGGKGPSRRISTDKADQAFMLFSCKYSVPPFGIRK